MVELSFVCPRIWEMLSISTPISASIYADIILKFCCIRIGFQDQPVFFFSFGQFLENDIWNFQGPVLGSPGKIFKGLGVKMCPVIGTEPLNS